VVVMVTSLGKKGERTCLNFLQMVFSGSAVYIGLVLGVVNTYREGTIILLIDRLTNIYPIAIIVVVVVMVISPCESLLWYGKADCR